MKSCQRSVKPERSLKAVCVVVSLCLTLYGCGGKQDSKASKKTATAKNGSSSNDKQGNDENSVSSNKNSSKKSDARQETTTSDNSKNVESGKQIPGVKEGSSKQETIEGVGSVSQNETNGSSGSESSSSKSNNESDTKVEPSKLESQDDSKAAFEKLNEQVANFQVPPIWLQDVTTKWDVANKPWKEARIEIRRLLGLNAEAARREGIKLTWDYLQKDDIGDKHEYGMYMFLGGEPVWAVIAYRERLATKDLNYPPFFGVIALASLYSDYGAYEEAEKILKRGVKMRPPKREWYEMREAEMHDALGDLYAVWGKMDLAKASYREAIRLYPLGKPPYGRHLLPRRAKKVQTKLDLLSSASLAGTSLKDGSYQETALGYSGDIKLTVRVTSGKIAKIDVRHQEKIDQNACKIIPQRIVEKQSLTVDGISGATITKDAIVAGTLRALRQAGLD